MDDPHGDGTHLGGATILHVVPTQIHIKGCKQRGHILEKHGNRASGDVTSQTFCGRSQLCYTRVPCLSYLSSASSANSRGSTPQRYCVLAVNLPYIIVGMSHDAIKGHAIASST